MRLVLDGTVVASYKVDPSRCGKNNKIKCRPKGLNNGRGSIELVNSGGTIVHAVVYQQVEKEDIITPEN